jgi:hypothetical protein
MDAKAFPPALAESMDVAFEVRELGELLVSRPDMAQCVRDFIDVGSPLFRAEVDHAATETTGHFVVGYEPSDGLHALLAAMRAGQRKLDHPAEFGAAGHR